MSEISRVALFGKLNPLAYKAIEGATVFCKMRGNPYVELVHWLAQLLQTHGHRPPRHHPPLRSSTPRRWRGTSRPRSTACRAAPRRSPTSPSTSRTRSSAPGSTARCSSATAQVRSGYLLVGMLKTPHLRNALLAISREFEKLKVDDLADNFAKSCGKTAEQGARSRRTAAAWRAAQPGEETGAMAPAAMGKQEALKKFAVDLTAQAREGRDGSR